MNLNGQHKLVKVMWHSTDWSHRMNLKGQHKLVKAMWHSTDWSHRMHLKGPHYTIICQNVSQQLFYLYEGWSESSRKSAIKSHCVYRFQWKFIDINYHSWQVDWNWNLENVTSYVWARGATVTSLRWKRPICIPGLLLWAKTRSTVWIDWYF